MRKLACLAAFSFALSVVAACSAVSDDDEGTTSADALTSLTVAQCKTPAVSTSPKKDSAGNVIAGSAHTTLSGCVVGSQGETGDAVRKRLTALLGDTARLGTVKNSQGAPVFSQFAPLPKQGTLATSLAQDINVTLAMSHSPYTKLRTVQRQNAAGTYSLSISNTTAVSASVVFFTVTVVNPGELSLTLEVKAQLNGITITGASDIILQQEQDQAASASVLVSDLFRWLTTELKQSAPPPQPIPVPANDAGDASRPTHDASANDAAATDASTPTEGGAPTDAASSG
jgi:hypothetical protein